MALCILPPSYTISEVGEYTQHPQLDILNTILYLKKPGPLEEMASVRIKIILENTKPAWNIFLYQTVYQM